MTLHRNKYVIRNLVDVQQMSRSCIGSGCKKILCSLYSPAMGRLITLPLSVRILFTLVTHRIPTFFRSFVQPFTHASLVSYIILLQCLDREKEWSRRDCNKKGTVKAYKWSVIMMISLWCAVSDGTFPLLVTTKNDDGDRQHTSF